MEEWRIMTKLQVVLLCCVTMLVTGCSSDNPAEDLSSKIVGYFGTPVTPTCYHSVDCKAGTVEFDMYGTTTESVIPIILITVDCKKFESTPRDEWETLHRDGTGYMPELQYKAEGYDSYPNSLDYTYTFKWATFSTVKDSGDQHGILRILYEANPYKVSRQLVVYLENENTGVLIFQQDANPDGVYPPANTQDENPEETCRRIYVHFTGFYKETVEICQDGRDEI